jgi:hypothetical protein
VSRDFAAGGKFVGGIVDNGGKTTLAKLVEKFATCVVNTGGAP